MFSKILVATDDSEHAQRALVVAGTLASRFEADLIVLHVFSSAEMNETTLHMAEVEHLMPARLQASGSGLGIVGATGLSIDPIYETDNYGVMYQAAEKVGQLLADDGANVARKAGAPKVNSIAQHGDPASVILDVAQHDKIDLIILGSRGLGTLKGLFMGSVSNKVNQLSDCCCITVK